MSIIPADYSTTIKSTGSLETVKLITKAAFNYHHTMSFMLRNRHFSDFSNFLFTKTLVPSGEGVGELAFCVVGPALQKFPQLAPFPRYLMIEVTSRCNKRCIMCEHTYWHEPSKELSLNELKHLADQFDLRHVTLAGEGDPFLNREILDIVRYLRSRHTSVYMDDSLDLVDKDTTYELVRLGVEGLCISMDAGTAETYEILKVGCKYDRAIAHLKVLLEAKKTLNSPVPDVCFRFVVNKKNMYEMAQMIENIQKIGPRSEWGDGSKVQFVGLLAYPEIRDLFVESAPKDEIAKVVKASHIKGSLPAIFIRTETDVNPSMNRCLMWMNPYCIIVPENVMIPCCAIMMQNSRQKIMEYSFGNYNTESARDIWNSPYYRWFRSQVTKHNGKVPMLCAGCRSFNTKERERIYGIDKRKREDFE